MSTTTGSRLAALLAALGVILGAVGAHGRVHDQLVARESIGPWETAVFYHLVHALALWILCGRSGPRLPGPGWCFLGGILLFSGSLYILALTRVPGLGPVTPVGGVALITGWLWLAVRPSPPRL